MPLLIPAETLIDCAWTTLTLSLQKNQQTSLATEHEQVIFTVVLLSVSLSKTTISSQRFPHCSATHYTDSPFFSNEKSLYISLSV